MLCNRYISGSQTFCVHQVHGHSIMSKRVFSGPDGLPMPKIQKTAAMRLKDNRDAMDQIIMAVKYSNDNLAKEVGCLKESNDYLHRQVERLDKYNEELELRMEALQSLVSRMLAGGNHEVVESHVHCMRAEGGYDFTDLDQLLQQYETEDDLDWFDEMFN